MTIGIWQIKYLCLLSMLVMRSCNSSTFSDFFLNILSFLIISRDFTIDIVNHILLKNEIQIQNKLNVTVPHLIFNK